MISTKRVNENFIKKMMQEYTKAYNQYLDFQSYVQKALSYRKHDPHDIAPVRRIVTRIGNKEITRYSNIAIKEDKT